MPLLNSVIAEMSCEACGKDLQPGEGVFLWEELLCYPDYEEALEGLASSFLVDQIKFDHELPAMGLIIQFEEFI